MRTLAISVVAALLLAACATPAQQAEQAMHDVDRMMQVYGPACDKLGYKNGTDQWRNCVMQLSSKDDLARYRLNYYGAYSPYWMY